MFCPQCQAEYRPGFSRCSDCEVDLVGALPEVLQAAHGWDNASPAGDYTEQLWRGNDPHFYLSLLWSVWTFGIRCLGRPTSPPAFDRSGIPAYQSAASLDLEIRVSEVALPLARWILDSNNETLRVSESSKGATALPQPERRDEAVSLCPLCRAEFATGTSLCPNCGVALKLSHEKTVADGSSRLLCDLPHPQFNQAIRAALRDAAIPFNNAAYFGHDIVLGRRATPSYAVIVLDSDYDRATRVLAQVLQHWEFEPGSGFDRPPSNPLRSYWPVRAVRSDWLPEDLANLAWSGSNLNTLNSVGSALQEHEIPYAVDVSRIGSAKLMVHPGDQRRAGEIVREVIDGVSFAENGAPFE